MSDRTATPSAIREWAAANGYDVAGRRGRMSAEIHEAFYAVHTPSGKPKGAGRKAKAADTADTTGE